MSTIPDKTRTYSKADPLKWPIQIQQTPFGWSITCYNADGHARHIASAENEMQALRSALYMSKAYHTSKKVLLSGIDGVVEKDLDRLIKH